MAHERRRKGFNARTRSSRHAKREGDAREIAALERGAAELALADEDRAFARVPLSARTRQGLKRGGFIDMTDIQAQALPPSLRLRDVLAAAPTGSGKTLAFLIPVLEALYRKRWSAADGLGALVISPTRELAMQIFEVLRAVGGAHTFSAGLVIGGKDLKHEQDRLRKMNILVATPGRLLQHLDQTVGFDASSLQVLVLDEADRILDMGFANTLNAILEHLPRERQTLLFSATQTRRVKDLARLSLRDAACIGARDAAHAARTPAQLEQFSMAVALPQKLDMLFSFLRAHTQQKTLVFFSSCRQVQFVHEVFRRLRPGVPLMALHGKQKQMRRAKIFADFSRSRHAALFATDIAARGLDFPAVDWVVQVDAPDSTETYIHRVGRTARYQAQGKSLLFLLPSEEQGVLAALRAAGVPLGPIRARDAKLHSTQNQLQSFAFQDPELKHLAQRAFVSYVRSIHLHKDKHTFNVAALPLDEFAAALGLPGAPRIKLVKDAQRQQRAVAGGEGVAGEEMHAGASGGRSLPGPGEAGAADLSPGGDDSAEEASASPPSPTSPPSPASASPPSPASASSPSPASASPPSPASASQPSPPPPRPPPASAPRTRHDRLFGRTNQTVLSRHYTGMVASDESDAGDAEDGDLLTLTRADHELDEHAAAPAASELSKRRVLQGQSKKAMAAMGKRGASSRVVFDDEGTPRSLYELKNEQDFLRQGPVREQIDAWEAAERERMAVADVADKDRVKRKRQEKKRKIKEYERQLAETPGARSAAAAEYDGEHGASGLADLVLPEEEEDAAGAWSVEEDEQAPRPPRAKRARRDAADGSAVQRTDGDIAAQEAMALRLLGGA
ncbi:RNA helicase [Malassezia sp. CBS 17886]|nr:RNA helicase [Malassezia sp. CBS 17886]